MLQTPLPARSSSLLVLFGLFCAALLQAQGEMVRSSAVERLQVHLWPEYDRPEMLVMLRGELAAAAPTPTQLTLPVPAGVTPHAVAWRDAQGVLKLAEHTLNERRGGEGSSGRTGQNLTMGLASRAFQAEYYAPLVRDGDVRRYGFEWTAGPGVESLVYEVQLPPGGSDLEISPAPTIQSVGGDGLLYARGDLGTLAPGETRRIELSYRRSSDQLTVPSSPAAVAPAPLPPIGSTSGAPLPVSPGDSATPWWPVYIAAGLLACILVALLLKRSDS